MAQPRSLPTRQWREGHTPGAPSAHTGVAGPVLWGDVSGKPETAERWPTFLEVTGRPLVFPPEAHDHVWADLTNPPATATRWPDYGEVTGKPTTFAPSAHAASHQVSGGDLILLGSLSGTLAKAQQHAATAYIDVSNEFTAFQHIVRSSSNNAAIGGRVTGDANDRWQIREDGRLGGGNGTDALDAFIVRTAVGQWGVTGNIVSSGKIGAGIGVLTTVPSAPITANASVASAVSDAIAVGNYSSLLAGAGSALLFQAAGGGSTNAGRLAVVYDTGGRFNMAFQTQAASGAGPVQHALLTGHGQLLIGSATPDPAAALDVVSTSRGLLPPRMTTTQRDAISATPPAGLQIFNTTVGKTQSYDGTAWQNHW